MINRMPSYEIYDELINKIDRFEMSTNMKLNSKVECVLLEGEIKKI